MLSADKLKKLDNDARMREVYDMRVYVVGGGFQYLKMFFDAGFKGATSVADSDIVCFTGGEDVDPRLYDEQPLDCTHYNPDRDARETIIYAEAMNRTKPMIGICRGSQFLNVMNRGKLWQDVNHHAVHKGHAVVDMRTGEVRQNMTSTHHQQMIPGPNCDVIALARESTIKRSFSSVVEVDVPEGDDAEVLWYPDSLSLCFQPHPEFQHGDCRDFFLDLVDEYILPAC